MSTELEAAGIFHDLSNLLTTLILNLEQATLSNHELKRQLYLSRAMHASKQMKRLLANIVAQNRKQQQKIRFKPLNEILTCKNLFAEIAKSKNIEITIQTDTEHYELRGNPVKFCQIISNIVSNGIDAYENHLGTRQILIQIKEKEEHLIIKISNWGKPLEDWEKDQIFKAFYSNKNQNTNSGLRLFIAKDLIENEFNGKIEVINDEDKTEFKLHFPIRQLTEHKSTYNQNHEPF